MKIAAMDLGTNTFRLLITENTGGKLREIYRETNITRLGEGLNQEKIISDVAVKRSLEILKKYKSVSKQHGVNRVLAAGTSAFRNALNREKVVKYFREQTGIDIDVITGDKEAALTVKGILKCMNIEPGHCYHLDIGGGSTEISLINGDELQYSRSMELGVVSLAEENVINRSTIDDITRRVGEIIKDSLSLDIKNNRNLPLLATSGTPIVVACILNSINEFDSSRVNNIKIGLEQVERIKNQLIRDYNCNELNKYGDLLRGREDLIVPGTIILSETMKYLGNDCMIISKSGLLEGLSFIEN